MRNKISYISLALILAYLFIQMLATGWNLAVEMLTDAFYQEFEVVPVNVPKTSELPVEGMICRIFRPDCKMALSISWAENETRQCNRVSSTGDVGVFQINARWHSWRGNLYDCLENIRIAKQIFDEQGHWEAWVAYNNGRYLRFLN